MSQRWRDVLTVIVLFGICGGFAFAGFEDGKHAADKWYAKRCFRSNDVLAGPTGSTFWIGTAISVDPPTNGTCLNGEGKWVNCTRSITIESPADDVTVIGHGVTVVNGSHVVVIQCSDETNGTVLMLKDGKAFVCGRAQTWQVRHDR